jgi:hypothetical protein
MIVNLLSAFIVSSSAVGALFFMNGFVTVLGKFIEHHPITKRLEIKSLLTFERVVVAPVGHDSLLHFLVKRFLHAVHIFSIVDSTPILFGEWASLTGFLEF